MTTVILAEKPDQGEKFATALAGKKLIKKGGKFEFQSEIFGETIVTWGIGHLVGLSLPEKYNELPSKERWAYENLPFLPAVEVLKYEVAKDKGNQFRAIKECLEKATTIVIATDPDREGENIAYNIFKLCKKSIFKVPMKRLWVNSLEKKEILRGFANLRDATETESYYKEANARQIADFLVGMNYTELYTLKLSEKGVDGVVSVGRVQTPVNTLVVENDLAIKNFKPEAYKVIECESLEKQPVVRFKNSKEYFDQKEFEIDTKKYGLDSASKGIVKEVAVTDKETPPQKLFSLGDIQEYANKRWKYPAKKTDKIIQGLYDRGILSYPRTDSNLITTNEYEVIKAHLEILKALVGIEADTPIMEPRKRFVDNEKVLEHYALIPTAEVPDSLNKLTGEEQNIYKAIATRACLMFAENYKYQNTKVTLDVNGLEFYASGNVPVSFGWKQSDKDLDEADGKEDRLPAFSQSEEVSIKICFIDKQTKEPARMTEGKLVGKTGVMAKLGLGTPATRSNIIETLLNRQYIKIENTKVYPTPKGYLLWDLTRNKDLLIGKPETTAQWEQTLTKIAKKEYTREGFLKQIYKYIGVTVAQLKDTDFVSEFLDASVSQNKLTIGGYDVTDKKAVFVIKNRASEEEFTIFKTFFGKKISNSILEELLTKGETKKPIKKLIGSSKKPFDARLKWNSETKKIELIFENHTENTGNKPKDGGKSTKTATAGKYEIFDKGKFFEIKDTTNEEKFIIFKNNAGKILNESIIKELLTKGRTAKKVDGFKSQKDTKYSAYLVFDAESKKVTKDF